MTISLEDHAALRLSGRLVQPMDCTCDEYAACIVEQAAKIKRLEAELEAAEKARQIEFEVWCSCGNGLCNQTKNVKGRIEVEPCEKCLDRAHGEGHEEEYNERDKEGF